MGLQYPSFANASIRLTTLKYNLEPTPDGDVRVSNRTNIGTLSRTGLLTFDPVWCGEQKKEQQRIYRDLIGEQI